MIPAAATPGVTVLVEPEASTALCLQEELYDGPPRGAVPNQYSADLCLAATISILAAVSGHMVETVKLECYKCSFISHCHSDRK